MARACTGIQVTLALMSLVFLLTCRDVQASAIREKDSPAINLKSPSYAGDTPQAEPLESSAGNTSPTWSLNITGGADNSVDNGLITPIFHTPKAGSKFSRKKMWFARKLNEGVFVAGQLNPRQIKYAADSGFKSIVSVFTQPGERSPTGKRLVISTAEERKIVENLSGMKFFTVLEADEYNDWSNVKVVEKMSHVYPQLEFPALLHCAKGVTVVLATLLHYANQTVHDPLFEPRVDSERFYYIARKHGLDFVEVLNVTRDTVKEITGEDMPDSAVKPNGTVLYNYWQAYPVYDGFYIAGQIQQRDLQTIKSVGISTIVNVRSGLSTNGKPSQETVELINIKTGTPTYATSHMSSRQSKRGLQRSIIDPNKPNTYIGKNSNVNYESRSPSEFGDNIGYNEQIERAAIKAAGVDYAHMPLVAMTEFREFFKNNKDKLMEIGKKGPVLVHCSAARRAAKVAVLAAALQYNLPFDWALQRLKEMGFGISAETEPETYNVYKDYLSTDRNSSANIPFYEVVVKEEAPFVMAEKDDTGKVSSFSGMAIELLKMVSDKAHFSYNIKLTDHDSYGYQDSQGNWQGLISELTGNSADLAVGPIPVPPTQNNLNNVEYTKHFMSSGVKLLINVPPSPSTTRGIGLMLEPFAAEVWVMIILAFIIISLALFLVGRFSPYEWARVSKDKDPRYARTSFGLKNSFLFAASTLSWQGYREAPRSISGRILMCMWFMFTVFVMVAYTACLCAILTTRNDSKPQRVPFTSYDDIIENKQVTLGAMKYGYVYSLLKSKSQHNDLLSRMSTYIDNSQEWIQNWDEGVQRVKDSGGRYAMVVESMKAEYVTATNCDLITYGDMLANFGYGFAVKGSPLLDRLNLAILQLSENGSIHRLITKYFYDRNVCPDIDKSKLVPQKGESTPYSMASSMDMRDMAIPFLFFFLGVLGAGGALAAELYYRKRLATKKDPDDNARQPLNTEAGASKAPKTSPPPPPIYKVNNKLQDTAKEKEKKASPEKASPDGKDKDIEKGGIEMVPMDDKVEADRTEETPKDKEEVEVEVKKAEEPSESKAETINEVA